jgi:hypothetical protein
MRASRTKKPGVGTRARAKRPGATGARKGGENGEKRVAPKATHPKPRGGKKVTVPAARTAKPVAAREPAAPVAKPRAVHSEPATVQVSAPPPRGNPPPLPAPIASFNF